jgi:hypothetical protein
LAEIFGQIQYATKPAVFGLLAFLLFGCAKQKLRERLDDAQRKAISDQIEYAESTDSAEIKLSWQQALKILRNRNPEIKRGTTRLHDVTQERRRFLWRELSPRLSAVASLSSALGQIASVEEESPESLK